MNRRKYIKSLILTSLGCSVGFFAKCQDTSSNLHFFYPNELGKILSLEDIKRLGQIFLLRLERHYDLVELKDLVMSNYNASNKFFPTVYANDIDRESYFVLDGWIIPRTEALQCAIISLEDES